MNTVESTNSRKTGLALEVLTTEMAKEIDAIFDKYERDPSRLVNILLDIQEIVPKQYIPKEIASYVEHELDVPASRVYDVISFYAALSTTPRADYVIQVCDSVVCKVVGNEPLKQTLESIFGIKIGEITQDSKYALEYTPCFGACDIAPAMRLNGKVYGHLTDEAKVKEALKEIL